MGIEDEQHTTGFRPVETFAVNKANELTTVSRSGTLTVAGSFGGPESSALPVTATVNSQAAIVYGDNTPHRKPDQATKV